MRLVEKVKILVVGGSGFLGSEIVRELLQEGHVVRSLSRKRSSLDVEQFIGDIAQPNSYKDLIFDWQPEAVIQAAWVTDQLSYRESSLNHLYARNTLTFAEHCFQSETQHFLTLGTSAEYGHPSQTCNASTTPCLPLDLYGAEKLWTSEEMKKIALNYETRFSWARVFQPYGLNQDPNRLVPSAAQHFKTGKKFKTQSSENILDWITSRDVAGAVAYTLKHELPELIDIGTSAGTSVSNVLNKVAELCGVDENYIEEVVAENAPQEPFELVVDVNSPLLAHGWKPKDDLESGLSWALSL